MAQHETENWKHGNINKFIKLEKRLSPILIAFGILYVGFFAGYHSLTGKSLLNIRSAIAYFLWFVAFFFLLFFISIFPKKYPDDFKLYKKHVKENYDFKSTKRALVGLPLILVGFIAFGVLITRGVRFIDLHMITDIIALILICGMGLYHVYQIET